MRNKELERQIEEPFMRIIPQSANYIIIVSREGNAIDVRTDPAVSDQIFIITTSGKRVTINKDGSPMIECGGK